LIIREALAQGTTDLKYASDNKINTPGLDAALILAHVLNTSRTSLIAAGTDILSEENCAAYCKLIEQRASGECVAYITGKKEFRELEFIVNPSVLVPRLDTEILVEAVIKNIDTNQRGQIKILDLCTGSGAVAISLKHEMPDLEIYASDISAEALETAKQNAAKLLPAGKEIHFYQGDLYSTLGAESFSIIASNPPYIPSDEIKTLSAEVQNEPRLALDGGKSGIDIIERIIQDAVDYLLPGGSLLLEADPKQMEKISALLTNRGFKNIKIHNDLSEQMRVIEATI
jgi:release factor glutamine methyltransferase